MFEVAAKSSSASASYRCGLLRFEDEDPPSKLSIPAAGAPPLGLPPRRSSIVLLVYGASDEGPWSKSVETII